MCGLTYGLLEMERRARHTWSELASGLLAGACGSVVGVEIKITTRTCRFEAVGMG